MVSFNVSSHDAQVIREIARRAVAVYRKNGMSQLTMDILMDLTAAHANGCPLDLDALLAAEDANLIHDVSGIARNLDRGTGQLHCFWPRFAAPTGADANQRAQ